MARANLICSLLIVAMLVVAILQLRSLQDDGRAVSTATIIWKARSGETVTHTGTLTRPEDPFEFAARCAEEVRQLKAAFPIEE